MRIDYTQNPPETYSAEEQRIVEKVKECRGNTGLDLLPVDLTLLHAPQIASGKWELLPSGVCVLIFRRLARPLWRNSA
jgi:hypothetical protein